MQPYDPSARPRQQQPHHHAPQQQQQPQQQQALDDLLSGINEWRNIQDVVRITFKAFHDVLRQQAESIKVIERTLDTKAGRAEVSAALQQKANASEMAARLAELEMVLHKKADVVDMDRRALKTELDASLRTQMSDVFTIINTKSEAVETRAWRESSERQLGSLAAEVSRLQQGLDDARAQLHSKAGVMEVGQALAIKADLSDLEDKLRDKPSRRQVSDALALKADLAGVDLTVGQMRQELSDLNVNVSRRAELGRLEEVSQRVEVLRQRVEADSDTTAAALRTISSTFDEALMGVQQRVEEAEAGVSGGVEQLRQELGALEEEVMQGLDVHSARLEDLEEGKADAEGVHLRLRGKSDVEDVERLGVELEGRVRVEDMAGVLERVGWLEGVCEGVEGLRLGVEEGAARGREVWAALGRKAEVGDVNAALVDVCGELERRAALGAVEALAAEQAALRAALGQRGPVARWLWRSGVTKGGGAVPWNVQAANSDPNNFLWEPDKTVVMAMLPGLYKVEVGVYCRHQPVVQVLVDGEPVMTLVNSSNATALHHRAQAQALAPGLGQGPGAGLPVGFSRSGLGAGLPIGFSQAGLGQGQGVGQLPSGFLRSGGGGYSGSGGGASYPYPGGPPGQGPAAAEYRGRSSYSDGGGGGEGGEGAEAPPPHPGGNMTGVTCVEFLLLPARARVAVTFRGGEQRAEGFLALHKL